MSKNIKNSVSNIENQVMAKIKSGQIKMRPKSYYLVLGLLGIVAIILLCVAAVYLISITSLWVRVLIADGPAYGAKRNLSTILGSFPWWVLIMGFMTVSGIIYLVRKFGHIYKVRKSYLIAAIITFLVVLGFALSYVNLPGLNNNHKSDLSCSIDRIDCNYGRGLYGR